MKQPLGVTESAEVYLWRDTEEPTTLRPIPYERVNTIAHDLDVSSLVNIPPDLLVTCSFDGKIVVWQKGVLKHSLKDPEWANRVSMTRGMQKLVYLPFKPSNASATVAAQHRSGLQEHDNQLQILAAAGTDGYVHFWNLGTSLVPAHLFQVQVFPKTKTSFGVVQMCADHTLSFLCCGNARGLVKVFDITQIPQHKSLHAALPCHQSQEQPMRSKHLKSKATASTKDSSGMLPLLEFRAHARALISMQCVNLNDDNVIGSAAIITATLDEIRIWSIEGEHIGQFGRDQWDLSVGIKALLVDKEALENDVPDEQDIGMSELLSSLWVSDAKIIATESEDEILEDVKSPSEKDPREMLQTCSIRFFVSEETSPQSHHEIQVGKQPKRMPRDWVRPKKFDNSMFRKVKVSDITDTIDTLDKSWTSSRKGEGGASIRTLLQARARPPSNAVPVRPSLHTTRLKACIRELSATPSEFRPGFVHDPDLLRPSTPVSFAFVLLYSVPKIVSQRTKSLST